VTLEEQDRPFLLAVFGAGVFVRLGFLFLWDHWGLVQKFPPDPYARMALSWLGWIPPIDTIAHPPLYPAFLAAVFWIFRGMRDGCVPVLQCFLSAGSPLLLYVWALRHAQRRTAKLAAVWMALDPALIFFAPQYQSETLFVFLVLLFFLLLDRVLESQNFPQAVAVGVAGAAASLCRGVFLAYAPFLGIALIAMKRLRLLVFLAFGWAIPILFWAVRNHYYYCAFVPVSVQSGWNMYEGFTLDREELRERPIRMGREIRGLKIDDPVEIDRYFQNKINHWIRENPTQALRIVFFKFFRYWRPWAYDPYPRWVRVGTFFYFTFLLLGAAWGAVKLRAIAGRLLPMYALFFGLTVIHSVYFTSLRYRLPLEPFLCFLAAAGLDQILCRSAGGGAHNAAERL
jgi:hypothetical protein